MRLAAILSIAVTVAVCGRATADGPAGETQRTAFTPCIGRGYVPYSYPAVGSCPCGASCCFHPWRYYCGGKSYKRQWFRTWFGAHFGKGSMLDQYPCECLFPTVGRAYISSQPVPRKAGVVPPAPSAEKK